MSSVPFPGPGQDGEQPPPGAPAWDGPEDDFDMDAEMAQFLADIEAGREQIPEPWRSPSCTVSLGDACDVDLAELTAMAGPDGLGGEAFAQDKAADALRPGPVLAALTEQAVQEMPTLSDNGLLGAVSAVRRLRARADYLETELVAEFARRRSAQFEAAKAAKVPRGCREGEFADAELAMELVTTGRAASDHMEMAADLTTRLPCTLAGLAAGTIDRDRAAVIWHYTRFLSDADVAQADKILAGAAPGLRTDLLARRAAKLEMKLDPEGTKRRKDEARNHDRRVEARREPSGNASLAGRELDVADVMAAKAQNDADAAALRAAGMPGSLRELRVLAYTDRLQGKNPMDRITDAGDARAPGAADDPAPGSGDHQADHPHGRHDPHGEDVPHGHDDPHGDDDVDGEDGKDGQGGDGGGGSGGPGGPPGSRTPPGSTLAPFPALITLTVPAGALLGWSTTPGEAGTWGLTGPEDTRSIVQAASRHPKTRWCVTVTGPDGTAMAHGCSPGQHPWRPEPRQNSPGNPRDGTPNHATPAPGPDDQAAQLAELLRRLNITLAPIAKGTCDHRHKEDRYTPSRRLTHLVRARTATCSAPGCAAQAVYCDLDHSVPYPDGITCECDLAPKCRRHHRAKQAPGWRLEQPEPGVIRWTTPAGRTYTTTPTIYDL